MINEKVKIWRRVKWILVNMGNSFPIDDNSNISSIYMMARFEANIVSQFQLNFRGTK